MKNFEAMFCTQLAEGSLISSNNAECSYVYSFRYLSQTCLRCLTRFSIVDLASYLHSTLSNEIKNSKIVSMISFLLIPFFDLKQVLNSYSFELDYMAIFRNVPTSLTKPFSLPISGKSSAVPNKKVITNKTVLPPVVKQEFAKRPTNHNNNNIPSHLDVPKKLPSAKKSPPPEIKSENIKLEGKISK